MFLFTTFSVSIGINKFEEKSFLSWMHEHNRMYVGDEYAFRLGIFLSNQRYIQEHNRGDYSFKLSMNMFSASTQSEYRAYLSKPSSNTKRGKGAPLKLKYDPLPDSWDWRKKGVITPIFNQEGCGSGWAFAAAGCQESTWAIHNSKLIPISVSQVLDCDWDDDGCEGGTADGGSFYVLLEQGGKWMAAADYHYKPFVSECKFAAEKAVETFTDVHYTGNETDMAHTVAEYGVLAFGYDASLSSFEYYSSGVYDDNQCDPWNLCHYMTIVGFGTDAGKDYWLVKNSFGTSWGIEGYAELVRNKNGQCGIDILTYTHLLPQ